MAKDQRFADLISRVRAQLDQGPNPQATAVRRETPEYTTGEQLSFTVGGNATPYLLEGWSPPEPQGAWALGPSCLFELRIRDENTGDLLLEVTGEPFVHEQCLEQRIRVYCGNSLSAVWSAREPGEFATILFGHTIKDGWIRLRFELPDAMSPQDLGLAQDSRRLGFSFYTLRLSKLA